MNNTNTINPSFCLEGNPILPRSEEKDLSSTEEKVSGLLNDISPFNESPKDIKLYMCEFLDWRSAFTLSFVNKTYRNLIPISLLMKKALKEVHWKEFLRKEHILKIYEEKMDESTAKRLKEIISSFFTLATVTEQNNYFRSVVTDLKGMAFTIDSLPSKLPALHLGAEKYERYFGELLRSKIFHNGVWSYRIPANQTLSPMHLHPPRPCYDLNKLFEPKFIIEQLSKRELTIQTLILNRHFEKASSVDLAKQLFEKRTINELIIEYPSHSWLDELLKENELPECIKVLGLNYFGSDLSACLEKWKKPFSHVEELQITSMNPRDIRKALSLIKKNFPNLQKLKIASSAYYGNPNPKRTQFNDQSFEQEDLKEIIKSLPSIQELHMLEIVYQAPIHPFLNLNAKNMADLKNTFQNRICPIEIFVPKHISDDDGLTKPTEMDVTPPVGNHNTPPAATTTTPTDAPPKKRFKRGEGE